MKIQDKIILSTLHPYFFDRINRMYRIVASRPEAGQAISHRLRRANRLEVRGESYATPVLFDVRRTIFDVRLFKPLLFP